MYPCAACQKNSTHRLTEIPFKARNVEEHLGVCVCYKPVKAPYVKVKTRSLQGHAHRTFHSCHSDVNKERRDFVCVCAHIVAFGWRYHCVNTYTEYYFLLGGR